MGVAVGVPGVHVGVGVMDWAAACRACPSTRKTATTAMPIRPIHLRAMLIFPPLDSDYRRTTK